MNETDTKTAQRTTTKKPGLPAAPKPTEEEVKQIISLTEPPEHLDTRHLTIWDFVVNTGHHFKCLFCGTEFLRPNATKAKHHVAQIKCSAGMKVCTGIVPLWIKTTVAAMIDTNRKRKRSIASKKGGKTGDDSKADGEQHEVRYSPSFVEYPSFKRWSANVRLSHSQKQSIIEEGYVHIPGVVPQIMVDRALSAINHSMGVSLDRPGDAAPSTRSRSYCTELQRQSVIMDLLHKTPALSLAESAIGEGKMKKTSCGQIKLRFPSLLDPPPEPTPGLDGMHTPSNGFPKGKVDNYTMLLIVSLSDTSEPYSGNFTVWPKSHVLFQDYFDEKGPGSLIDGMPTDVDLVDRPTQIRAKAGDVTLVHYQVANDLAVNVSPHVQYAVFFRLKHIHHDKRRWDAMTDIWLDWEGLCDELLFNEEGDNESNDEVLEENVEE